MIKNREYRYYSPVFLFNKNTGEIERLLSAGLTNRPNLYVKALCSEHHIKGENMDFPAKSEKALGLPDTATEDETITKITALNSELQTAMNRAQTPDLGKFVPRRHDSMSQRAQNAKTLLSPRGRNSSARLSAKRSKKLFQQDYPATKDFYKRMCNSEEGLKSFREFVTAAPCNNVAERS